ncbi:MAG TPA: zinc-binding dehydrogenase [Acetobacteraceae bacterium]|nr:zinc-binding dehydrogenase [Acetobacteraceae bacterium]
MKAAVVTETGVRVMDVPVPKPGPDEVLVRVRAAGMNRADLGVAAGKAHGAMGGAGTIIGLEFAGEVVEFGEAVHGLKVGDRIMASGSGGYAEYAVAHRGRIVPIPDVNMGWEEAATLPVALQTMHDAVVTNGRLQPGEAVMIQGASSGVGLMGLQIAKMKGARLVIGTSTNPARRARLPEFGADLALDTSAPDWPEQVLKATDGQGVELIVDQVSASVANGNMKAAAVLGRIVNVGRLGGTRGEFNFDLHALKRISYIGVTFRTRTPEEVAEIVARARADLGEAVASRKLRLPLDRSFALDEAVEALAYMEANRHFGKIVLTT